MHKKERDEEKEDILEVIFRVLPSIADVLQHHTFISQGKQYTINTIQQQHLWSRR